MASKPYRPTLDSTLVERLAYLAEECGEVQQNCMKAIRFGLFSSNPDLPPEKRKTNAKLIKEEFQDVLFAMKLLEDEIDTVIAMAGEE